MEISRLGLAAHQDARRSLAATATRVVREGPEAESLVAMKQAEQQAKLGVKLVETGRDLEDSLLDILA